MSEENEVEVEAVEQTPDAEPVEAVENVPAEAEDSAPDPPGDETPADAEAAALSPRQLQATNMAEKNKRKYG